MGRDWIEKNVPAISVGAISVSVSEGSVILHLK